MLTRRQFILTAAGLAGVTGLPLSKAEATAWRRGAEAPTRRSEVASAVLRDRIYLIGGFGAASGGPVEAYDPMADRWERRAPLLLPLHHTVTVAVKDRLFVTGGYREGWTATDAAFAQVEIFDPASNTWGRAPDLPTPRHGLGVVAFQGRLYTLAGGPTPGGSASAAVEILEP